jgi:TRAP-type mannitol/chloroaromatic compound transport system substrate-binding protein
VRWRLSSTFPKSLDTLYGTAEVFAKFVSEATDGKFQIQSSPQARSWDVQAFDAVSNGTVELIHGPGYYYVGKDPPSRSSPTSRLGLMRARRTHGSITAAATTSSTSFSGKFNVHAIAAGNTGTQMGGWFRKEIKTVQDVQGLKFRIAGLAGQVLAKLGAVPQQIAGGDIYPALERGTIDAAEWVGPVDDEKLGFAKVAPYYYYPGFWEGGPTVHMMFSKPKWDALPKAYKGIVENACAHANMDMTAKYDARNPAALRRLVAAGAQLRPFSQEIMEAAFKAANEIYDETSAKNPDFKKMYDSLRAFRNEEYLWWQVAEYTFDNFMIRARARG